MFVYKNSTEEIMTDFKNWCGGLPLLFIDNNYTLNYLKDLDNLKEPVFKYLNMQYNDDVIDEVIVKYNLQPSNHIVDLLYEALIYENSKGSN